MFHKTSTILRFQGDKSTGIFVDPPTRFIHGVGGITDEREKGFHAKIKTITRINS